VTADENKGRVRDYFAARERGDANAVRGMFTDDARWWVPQSARTIERPLRGREAVMNLLTAGGHYRAGSQSWRLHQLIGDADFVAVPCAMRAETVSGLPYLNEYVYVFRFVDGAIAEVWENLDTAYAFARLAEDGNAEVLGVPLADVIADPERDQ
jgi:ketosteroid isomerase-like protein